MTMTAEPASSKRPGRLRRLPCGPGRRLTLGVAVGFIALIGGTIWKMRSLDGLPDVGDPFDVAEMRGPVEIPDADNAFVDYAAAARQLVIPPETTDETGWDSFCGAVRDGEFKTLAWSLTTPKHRAYLEARRAALETWREGSGRPDAVYHQPGRVRLGSVMNLIDEMALLAGMAALEGSRLEDAARRMKPGAGTERSCDAAGSSAGTGTCSIAITARSSTPWPPVASCDGRPTRTSGPTSSAVPCTTP